MFVEAALPYSNPVQIPQLASAFLCRVGVNVSVNGELSRVYCMILIRISTYGQWMDVVCLCATQKMQDMDERRIRRMAEAYCQFSDIEKKVLPIISKCLEGISAAGMKIDEKQVNVRRFYVFF